MGANIEWEYIARCSTSGLHSLKQAHAYWRWCAPPKPTFNNTSNYFKWWYVLQTLIVFPKKQAILYSFFKLFPYTPRWPLKSHVVWTKWPLNDQLIFMSIFTCFHLQFLALGSENKLFEIHVLHSFQLLPYSQLVVKEWVESEWSKSQE